MSIDQFLIDLNSAPAIKNSSQNAKKIQKKLETHSESFSSKLKQIEKKMSVNKVNKSEKINHGTKIADKKELREFANNFEKNFMVNMWTASMTSVIEPDKKDVTDILYMPEFIRTIVEASVKDEGGRISDKVYESLEWKFENK